MKYIHQKAQAIANAAVLKTNDPLQRKTGVYFYGVIFGYGATKGFTG